VAAGDAKFLVDGGRHRQIQRPLTADFVRRRAGCDPNIRTASSALCRRPPRISRSDQEVPVNGDLLGCFCLARLTCLQEQSRATAGRDRLKVHRVPVRRERRGRDRDRRELILQPRRASSSVHLDVHDVLGRSFRSEALSVAIELEHLAANLPLGTDQRVRFEAAVIALRVAANEERMTTLLEVLMRNSETAWLPTPPAHRLGEGRNR